MTFGFIGLGDMGLPMAHHLLASGHQVTVWNRSKHKLDDLAKEGASIATTPSQLMQDCSTIGICLTSHRAVDEVCFGPNGLFDGLVVPSSEFMKKVVVDFSTGSPEAAREMAARACRRGVAWVDAPISGGPPAAARGALTILAGGEPAAVNAAMPLMQALAINVTHLGGAGSGQMVKLCNQLIVACNILAVAESISLARKAGVDTALLPQALAGGFADSRPLQIFGPRMVKHEFEPRLGAIELMEKDLTLITEMAASVDALTPMLSLARTLFGCATDELGIDPSGDISQAVLLFEKRNAPTHEHGSSRERQ